MDTLPSQGVSDMSAILKISSTRTVTLIKAASEWNLPTQSVPARGRLTK